MTVQPITLSVVVPTYGREAVLVETLRAVLALPDGAEELIVVDQTPRHAPETDAQLREWEQAGMLRWIRLDAPSVTVAMNRGLLAARGTWVLFLDDDIVPSEGLMAGHRAAISGHPEAWAVAGRVHQRGETRARRGDGRPREGLRGDLAFEFNRPEGGWVRNVMAGNLCVHRDRTVGIGGFDENFGPPVAFRFETEFAKRLLKAGGQIWFAPEAALDHLRAAAGGTRSQGGHLRSASPVHGVGDYYYALRCGGGLDRAGYMLWRPFREVRTRFHLSHPWWIPVKLVGELRALYRAMQLYRSGPRLLTSPRG